MKLALSDAAHDALTRLAIDERRDARHQAEYLIEAELKRRGLLQRVDRLAPHRSADATRGEGA